jgi:hypothetical protein
MTAPTVPGAAPAAAAADPGPSVAGARAALKEVEGVAASLDMYSTEFEGTYDLPSVGVRRRRLRAGESDPVSTVSLVMNDEGVLLWREGAPSTELAGRRMRRGATAPPRRASSWSSTSTRSWSRTRSTDSSRTSTAS